ncbi:MAG TPA: C25 family cysteine peptidase [Chitinophagaceae bacterium]|jgi:hypothetical protein
MKPWKLYTMRKLFTLIALLYALTGVGQPYNNEWIKPSQTYYKFKIGSNGLCRIPQSAIAAIGWAGTPVQQFQLWRNGQEVPLYTSVTSGVLPANGYIEFWGLGNDGKPDLPLYRDPTYQHSNKVSLISDTSVYFLTVNTVSANQRISDVTNNVAGNSLPAEPYFMYTYGRYFTNALNPGYAAVIGEYVYSGSYDKGEFWSTTSIVPSSPYPDLATNLFTYAAGPSCTFKYGVVGNALNARSIQTRINGTVIKDTTCDYFNDLVTSAPFPTNVISSGTANVQFINESVPSDRAVASFYEINYPRLFNFGGQANFSFTLAGRSQAYYLEITNFSNGSAAPVLYDLTSQVRYTGDISTPGLVKFALPVSLQDRQMILVSEDPSNYTTIAGSSFQVKNFIDFTNTANQGNYLIISNKILFAGDNPVEAFRQYRSSAQGGSYNAKTIDIDELVDQFAFGIRKHPLSIKNFLRFARAKFAVAPVDVFLIGRGTTYYEYRGRYESQPVLDQIDLIPTYGWPASDNLLASADGASPVALTNIGRLSAVSPDEVDGYLQKVKEYESAQQTNPNTIDGRAWMKNILQLTGASDNSLGPLLCSYMDSYRQIIIDTLVGGNVTQFCKSSTDLVEQVADDKINTLFTQGLGLVDYFGHSSATTLEFNLDNPQNYNNAGKYPVFSVNGCNAGNFFAWEPQRLSLITTMSEKFNLAKERGSVVFLASTHYGVVNYLNLYLSAFYSLASTTDYGAPVSRLLRDAMQKMLQVTGTDDYYARLHAEEMTLHGDPALKLNYQALPDYDMEASQVVVNPQFISVNSSSFTAGITMYNLGKAVDDSIVVEVKRQYPDNSQTTLVRKKIRGIRYIDSLSLQIPVVASRDKGLNKLIVTVDADNVVPEVTEANNSVTTEFYIYEDEASPAYPYNYSIVNQKNITFYASTANPFSSLKQYTMEIDTTEAFNSPLMVSKTISSVGGDLEFSPGINFLDSTVYYWRVALVPASGGSYQWNEFSFIYINGYTSGFNQSHYYQHLNSTATGLSLTSNRQWTFGSNINILLSHNGVYPTSGLTDADFMVSLNGQQTVSSGCIGASLLYTVMDPVTFQPWSNIDVNGNSLYRYGSADASCAVTYRGDNFEFSYNSAATRKQAMDFMDSIPNGAYVVVRDMPSNIVSANKYASDWKADTTLYGSGNSIYHKLVAAGITGLDSFNSPKAFVLVYRKGDPTFKPAWVVGSSAFENVELTVQCPTTDTVGYITSPVFGPAKAWKQVHWRGSSKESPSADNPSVQVIGIAPDGTQNVLFTLDKNTQDFDISSVNVSQYPNMQLRMRNPDSVTLTPYQLSYWRIQYDAVPEGALIPNLYFKSKSPTQGADSLALGEQLNFGIAFKNISNVSFDSLKLKMYVLDRNNVSHPILLPKKKPLIAGDSVHLDYTIDTKDYPGQNTLYVDFNPDNDQPEQYLFNNFLYRNFYVKPDSTSPLLDVTFDNVHILNQDIVSAKPHIQIKLKDEAQYMLLNDTSDMLVQVQFPDNTIKTYRVDGDTLKFTPAQSGSNNTATIDFSPQFLNQVNPNGDEYQLIVSGKDRSNNVSGTTQYKVTFRVISKPMISNLLNYPNPFTTSTAFVFTITGSEVPQNMKIQILTITGKIVREITKAELGPLHIGRNITEFKWNGTDQFGDRLANGVYIYRFVTQLNGIKMDKYTADGDNTDQYFNNGYGKMYLMK